MIENLPYYLPTDGWVGICAPEANVKGKKLMKLDLLLFLAKSTPIVDKKFFGLEIRSKPVAIVS